MIQSGMVEAQLGKIPVLPRIGSVSFLGLPEWLYLGECRDVPCFV